MSERPETTVPQTAPDVSRSTRVPIPQLVRYFLRLGTLGFGGPVALCGLMEKELVQESGWLNPREFLVAVAIPHVTLP